MKTNSNSQENLELSLNEDNKENDTSVKLEIEQTLKSNYEVFYTETIATKKAKEFLAL